MGPVIPGTAPGSLQGALAPVWCQPPRKTPVCRVPRLYSIFRLLHEPAPGSPQRMLVQTDAPLKSLPGRLPIEALSLAQKLVRYCLSLAVAATSCSLRENANEAPRTTQTTLQ